MQHGTPEQAACVRNAIEHGGRDDFAAVLAAIACTGALEHTRRKPSPKPI
jgi:octaprenyl-diphosphate synthase